MYILYRYILLHMSSVCVRGNIGFVGGIFSFFEGNVDFLFKLFGHLLRPESSWVAIFPQTFHFLDRIYCLFSLKKEGGGQIEFTHSCRMMIQLLKISLSNKENVCFLFNFPILTTREILFLIFRLCLERIVTRKKKNVSEIGKEWEGHRFVFQFFCLINRYKS